MKLTQSQIDILWRDVLEPIYEKGLEEYSDCNYITLNIRIPYEEYDDWNEIIQLFLEKKS